MIILPTDRKKSAMNFNVNFLEFPELHRSRGFSGCEELYWRVTTNFPRLLVPRIISVYGILIQ